MRRIQIILLAVTMFAAAGCVHTRVRTPSGYELERTAVGYEAEFKSVRYGEFEVEGYNGKVEIQKLIDALETIK